MKTSTIARPVADRVLVRRDDAETISKGGIVLPDAAQNRPTRGKVIAVGAGRLTESNERIPMEISEGDSVIFGSYAGQEVEIQGDTLLILKESDVMLVVGNE